MWIRTANKCNTPPDWAPPCTSFTLLTDGGALCCTHDQIGGAPADGWVDAGDGWELRLLDGETPRQRPVREDPDGMTRVKTPDGTWCPMQIVLDLMGEPWVIPMIFRPDGLCFLQKKIIWIDGLPKRVSTPEQDRLQTAAQYFLDLSEEYMTRSDEEKNLTIDCDVACTAELISAGHYIPQCAVLSSGILDEHLISRVWIATIGGSPGNG